MGLGWTTLLPVSFCGALATGCGAGKGMMSSSGSSSSSSGGSKDGLHVEGNRLVDGGGKTVRLVGVSHSGSEYACIQGWGFFDGPVDAAAVSAVAAWHANVVRVPLNEDCWLAINGAPAQYSGAAYESAIAAYVTLLRAQGLYVILDLHWNGPGEVKAAQQLPMADADHAPAFWRAVASTFKGDTGVIFDLYNEPYVTDWDCWRDGCSVSSLSGTYTTAGMQSLVSAVRATGAENVIMAGGLAYANDLTGWLSHKPSDPTGNLVASHHSYNFNACAASSCWTTQIQSVAAEVPVITGELGEDDCGHDYVDAYMAWADGAGVSYLGWAWNADFDCKSGPALISDWKGTPTSYGSGFRTHLGVLGP